MPSMVTMVIYALRLLWVRFGIHSVLPCLIRSFKIKDSRPLRVKHSMHLSYWLSFKRVEGQFSLRLPYEILEKLVTYMFDGA